MHKMSRSLPFPLLGLDSDNGSEFNNQHLYSYCQRNEIIFTRSRPYRKNDNAHVEQKNWSVVRQLVGYGRYTSRPSLRHLERVYGLVGQDAQLLPAGDEAQAQEPQRGQGPQGLRHRPDSVSSPVGVRRSDIPTEDCHAEAVRDALPGKAEAGGSTAPSRDLLNTAQRRTSSVT